MTNQMAVVPAQLGFLAIFNPSLGATDETIDDQIVYYASVNTQSQKRRHRSRGKPTADISQEERNERLRQIGLAQGMVEFSRGFSNGEPVNTIETEKTRVVLQEVEPGWWILASIDLSKIPLPPRIGQPAAGKTAEQPENVEYSSRELKPSTLLMRDLLRAHSMFLLHHASSLSALFVKSRRPNFIKILSRFWDLFLSTWDVMLHGNPASNVYRGIKIAACGELGVGVGEEERGSGEREVLEGFVDRVEGLTDLVVSKFGSSECAPEAEPTKGEKGDTSSTQWLGTGEEPGAEDGAIFLGVGALSRKSVYDITSWMEEIYSWGEDAYGVKESPTSTRQARRKRRKSVTNATGGSETQSQLNDTTVSVSHNASKGDTLQQESSRAGSAQEETSPDESGMNKFMSYLKMGYGTHWSLGSSENEAHADTSLAKDDAQPAKVSEPAPPKSSDDCGQYLVGLLGDLEELSINTDDREDQSGNESQTSEHNSRILLRTLTVELDSEEQVESEKVEDLGSGRTELTLTKSGAKDYMDPNSQFDSQDRNKTQKMRVVVYVNKPFIFTFLFRNRTDSLAWDGFYRSLHHQLAPLRKPLAVSTAYRPGKPDTGEKASHIFDLVWDPKAMTVHSTIPNIPTPAELLHENVAWSRAEAVNTHNQILNMYAATRTDYSELERTCKTSRGWWIVWTRILDRDSTLTPNAESESSGTTSENTSSTQNPPPVPTLRQDDSLDSEASHIPEPANVVPKRTVSKEIFLIRRAGEHTTGIRALSGSYAENNGGWAEGASRLVQGIGVDTNKYIEGLLNMGR
ncbi:hypothetical protein F5B22DRAFT_594963 [Xylaria bambusicola]|uniref:uncharacterized protein n=1 Tax=Xylaria bambusicola TaxID=326684 RepID=UPI002008E03D|nr:uncharacterized protein F5B22DRAFT_594963 [Xylaria bambusicola]KAI0522005.1 hypothetical protein F5B22DRAFT_594963 [Xylaria bambusicola]